MVYVSSYENHLRDGLDTALNKLPEEYLESINKITDIIIDQCQEKIRFYTEEYLAESIKEDIMNRAAKVAESMIMNALAGDQREIRNLFGFNDWYMKHAYVGNLPREWKLIEEIVKRMPEVFVDEKIKQLETQVKNLEKECVRLRSYWDGYEVEANEGHYITLRRKGSV